MRILITGGCGFLGSHVIEHFLKTTDAEIVVLDKLSYASNGFDRLRAIGAYDNPRVRVIGCDLSQPIPAGVDREVGDVDYVIHAAAETHVDNSIVDPVPFLQSNVMGTHYLLWWLKGRRVQPHRIFCVSTDEVYGPAEFGASGFDETAAFRPANPYAAAKAGGECVAMAYANTYRLPITITSTMNLIGERQHPEKFVPLVIRRAQTGEKVLIHADATRTRPGSRFYLHCRTFAHALAFLIQRDTQHRVARNTVYPALHPAMKREAEAGLPLKLHVCGEREISNLELAQLIADFVGRPLNYELVDFHSSRPGHDPRYAMRDELISTLGWERPMMLERSLGTTVQWYLDHPEWLGLKKENT